MGRNPHTVRGLGSRGKDPEKVLDVILLTSENNGILHSKKGKWGLYHLRLGS